MIKKRFFFMLKGRPAICGLLPPHMGDQGGGGAYNGGPRLRRWCARPPITALLGAAYRLVRFHYPFSTVQRKSAAFAYHRTRTLNVLRRHVRQITHTHLYFFFQVFLAHSIYTRKEKKHGGECV